MPRVELGFAWRIPEHPEPGMSQDGAEPSPAAVSPAPPRRARQSFLADLASCPVNNGPEFCVLV